MTKDEGCAIYIITQWPDVAFCMARQEVKPTLKIGFQVYRQFLCEEGFQDFCVGPILIANYILISPQFKKIDSNEIYRKLKLII